MKFKQYARMFTVSELWGPYGCSVKGCRNQSFNIFLTEEENGRLKEKNGPNAVIQMCEENIGVVLCKKHEVLAIEVAGKETT